MCHLREPRRQVVAVRDRLLAVGDHLRASPQHIILVAHRPLSGDFLNQAIQRVIGEIDGPRSGGRIARLRQPSYRIIDKRRFGAVALIGRCRATVERVIVKLRLFILAINERLQIPRQIILIGLLPVQRIVPRRQPIHVVIRVRRLLVLGIG